MSNWFSKIVMVWMVLGLSGAFAPLLLANQAGIKAGFQSTAGAKLGVFYAVDLGETLQFQPGVYYSLRNYKVPPPDWYDLVGEKIYDTLRFIEIPVLLKYRFNLKGPSQPFLFGGGYVAFKLSKETFIDNEFSSGSFRRYADVDSGIVVGLGIEHGRGRIKFHFDFRANFGLNWVQRVDYGMFLSTLSPPIKNKTRSFSIMLGVSV